MRTLSLAAAAILALGTRSAVTFAQTASSPPAVRLTAPRLMALRFKALVDPRGTSTPDAVVVVRGDSVVRVGRGAAAIPAGARVIDLRKYTALPGLIDVHTHMTFIRDESKPRENGPRAKDSVVMAAVENARRTLETGVTTVRDLGASNYTDIAIRDSINKGAMIGPRMFVAGYGLSKVTTAPSPSAVNASATNATPPALRGRVRDTLEIVQAIKAQVDAGADWIKMYGSTGTYQNVTGVQTFSDDEMRVAAAAAHRFGKPIAIHSYGESGGRAAMRAGAESVEHPSYLDDATLAEFAKRGTVYVPTIDHNRFYAENAALLGYTPQDVAGLDSFRLLNLATAKRAHKAGVKFAMGSDAVFWMFGENTRELQWFVEAGMTPAQAIQTATTNAAELLRMPKQLGRVAPGAFADIIAVEGDPLKDINAVIHGVRWVMKGGAVVVDKTADKTTENAMPGAQARAPNIVIMFIDDMGYADIGPFGAKGYRTPNLDRMAREGIKLTSFYTAQGVCSAARASLLTGTYPNRIGIHGALGPASKIGISDSETTIAELLKAKGYATGAFGKWHLGDRPQFLPTHHGFDEYYGLPYSNDMWPNHPEAAPGTYPPLPLIEGDSVAQLMPDQSLLTRTYTARAVRFIGRHKDEPFFLYIPHTMVHVPLFPGAAFKGKAPGGVYADVVRELDWSAGEIMKALKANGVDDNTLFIFTSDNGPWLSYGDHAGSAGPLREGKGTAWEGGVRVPFLARWPGRIPAGRVSSEPAMTIDMLPTIARLANAGAPARPIDGLDVWPILHGDAKATSPHEAFYFYYNTNELQAVRSGRWKLILPHTYRTLGNQPRATGGIPVKYRSAKAGLELYDLEADVGEAHDVAAQHADVVQRLLGLAEKARADMGDALTKRVGSGTREPGRIRE